MFAGAFGAAGAEVVIEDYLEGEEVSFFALSDGARAVPFASAQDHKRVGDGDTGPNTGGMGAYSPPALMTPAMSARVMREIIEPTVAGMAKRGAPFRGVLFAGLMIGADGPKLIEFNVRFGDPEIEAILARLDDDLLEFLARLRRRRLACASAALLRTERAHRDHGGARLSRALREGNADRRSRRRVPHAPCHRAACGHTPGRRSAGRRWRTRPCRHRARPMMSPKRRRGPMRLSTASIGPAASAGATSAGARLARIGLSEWAPTRSCSGAVPGRRRLWRSPWAAAARAASAISRRSRRSTNSG